MPSKTMGVTGRPVLDVASWRLVVWMHRSLTADDPVFGEMRINYISSGSGRRATKPTHAWYGATEQRHRMSEQMRQPNNFTHEPSQNEASNQTHLTRKALNLAFPLYPFATLHEQVVQLILSSCQMTSIRYPFYNKEKRRLSVKQDRVSIEGNRVKCNNLSQVIVSNLRCFDFSKVRMTCNLERRKQKPKAKRGKHTRIHDR